jgi:hypothetical protein
MVTLILGAGILTMFGAMFYYEDRMGLGVYDPDPTASDRHRRSKDK